MTPEPQSTSSSGAPLGRGKRQTGYGHLQSLAQDFYDAVATLGQIFGAGATGGADILAELDKLSASASATHIQLLSSLRSTYLLSLPRTDFYVLGQRLKTAVHNTAALGFIIQSAQQFKTPNRTLDALEILAHQADLVRQATAELQHFDALEQVWIQLERTGPQAHRALASWTLQDATQLLARQYYLQQAVAEGMGEIFSTIAAFGVDLGFLLVRES